MNNNHSIGKDVQRKDAWRKVTGSAKYNADVLSPQNFHGKILSSPYAHAKIENIDISKALKSEGVQAIITGEDIKVLSGSMIEDRPPIAIEKVRYFGEPVAVIVAISKEQAERAANLIKVEYEPLPIINCIKDTIKSDSILIHKDLGRYYYPAGDVYPKSDTNIADQVKIRKGDIDIGWKESDVIVESSFKLPKSDHIAMENRSVRAEISPDGDVIIYTTSQAPFAVKEELGKIFNIPEGKIIVRTPLVGGAFGGKATVQLEFIAYMASLAVGGKIVKIENSREEDITSSPSKIGVEAKLRLGATYDGKLKVLECIYYVDCGAYADTSPRMARAIATDCSGPYNIENIYCDSFTVYTNHNYATSYRGFGHTASTFCIERTLDQLAKKLNMDPLDLRLKNAIEDGNYTPTQDRITLSNAGNLPYCIDKLKEVLNWDEGSKIICDDGIIKVKGVSCFWKTSSSPTNATSGVIASMNTDGSINLVFGGVEIGPGTKTVIGQIFAERMKMDVENVHVSLDVDTQITPKHWKTVASMTTFMAGNAAIKAADDLIHQIKSIAAIVLRCEPKVLEIKDQRVFIKDMPEEYIDYKDISHGYKYPDGYSIMGQLISKGSYTMRHLKTLDKETGVGKSGVSWTVGAQGVEIEYNPNNHSYRILKAATVVDSGKVINPSLARGVIIGGMSMGIGLATREEFKYDNEGILENTSLRTYKLMRYGEQPEYIVNFIETPQMDAPFGARGIGEHGIIGIPSAIANAMSIATDAELNKLPLTPEEIWKTKNGVQDDIF